MDFAQVATAGGALIGGLAGVGALAQTFVGRRKVRADAADVIADTAVSLVDPLRVQVRELQAEVTELRTKLREERRLAQQEIDRLNGEVHERDATILELRRRTAH